MLGDESQRKRDCLGVGQSGPVAHQGEFGRQVLRDASVRPGALRVGLTAHTAATALSAAGSDLASAAQTCWLAAAAGAAAGSSRAAMKTRFPGSKELVDLSNAAAGV